jgi:hypothetical protein
VAAGRQRPGWPDEIAKKIAQQATQEIFCPHLRTTFSTVKSCQNFGHFCLF